MVTSLINDFRKYLDIVEFSKDDNTIDPENLKGISTTVLISLLMYYHRLNHDVTGENYVETILNFKAFSQNLFLKKLDFNNIDSYWEIFSGSFPKIDSEILFLIFQELVCNIKLYSMSKNAYFVGYEFKNSAVIDISCFDDGISIPASFERESIPSLNDSEAVYEAINGKSSHMLYNELSSYGLNRIANVLSKGFQGELLVASRGGLCYINEKGAKLYEIDETYIKGTLISMRFKGNPSKKDLWESLNPKLILRRK